MVRAKRIPLLHFAQPYEMLCRFSPVTGPLIKISLKISRTLWELCTAGDRGRVTDEKWALQGLKCPRSEPLLFTGSLLAPVRELSATELIWAASISAMSGTAWPLYRTMHPLSPSHFNPFHLSSIQFIICPNLYYLFWAMTSAAVVQVWMISYKFHANLEYQFRQPMEVKLHSRISWGGGCCYINSCLIPDKEPFETFHIFCMSVFLLWVPSFVLSESAWVILWLIYQNIPMLCVCVCVLQISPSYICEMDANKLTG